MKEVFTSETFQTLSDYIDAFMEDHDYDNVTIVIEKITEQGEDEPDYWWKATLVPKDTRNALEDLLVDEHGIVPLFFSEEDIAGRVEALFEDDLIPVEQLTREQMESVKYVLANSDCEYGLNWDAIDGAITDLFDDDSDPDEACERDRERHGTDGYENGEDGSESHALGGRKEFRVNAQIGSVKHSISYHDGAKKHKDGSRFFDLETFRSKKELEGFASDLLKNGYHKI